MATKKKAKVKSIGTALKNPDLTKLEVVLKISDAVLVQEASELQAERLEISSARNRNNFCARAIVAAAKKELGLV